LRRAKRKQLGRVAHPHLRRKKRIRSGRTAKAIRTEKKRKKKRTRTVKKEERKNRRRRSESMRSL